MEYSEFYIGKPSLKIDPEVKNVEYPCQGCILPGNYEFGQFEEYNGVNLCKFCRDFKEPSFKGRQALIQEIDLQKGEKLGITVSGGKDSIFAWDYLVKSFGKENVVAFNHNKIGLVHPLAKENLYRAQEILGTQLIVIEDDLMFPRFKKNLESLLNHPSPAMVRVALCAGCRFGITEGLYIKGEELGIRKYVSGASYLELAPFKEELLAQKGNGDDTLGLQKGLRENHHYKFEDNLKYILRDHEYKYKDNLSSDEGNGAKFKEYKLFDLDNYIPINPEEIEDFVVKNLNWVRPERSWHFDCMVEELKDVFYYGLLGYTETDFKLSAMVRHNIISLEEAIYQMEIVRTMTRNSFHNTREMLESFALDHLIVKMEEFYARSPYLQVHR